MNRLIDFVLCLSLLLGLTSSTITVYNTTECKTTNYFDTTELNCATCQTNAVTDSGELSCTCNAGFYYSQTNLIGWKGTCSACGSTDAPSADLKRCVTCPTTYDATIGDCACASGQAAIDMDITGAQITPKTCVTCATGAYPGPSGRRINACESCPNGMQYDNSTTTEWECVCASGYSKAGDNCVATSDLTAIIGTTYGVTAAARFTYTDLETSVSTGQSYLISSSDTITYFYNKAIVGCITYHNPTSCQTFANLCVLMLYNKDHTICKLYLATMSSINVKYGSDSGWITGLPWLYYKSDPIATITAAGIKLQTTLDTTAKSGSKTNHFEYYITSYYLNGTYVGIKPLTTELLLCSSSLKALDTIESFATPLYSACDFDVSLIEDKETVFFELFIKDSNDKMVDIPVKIINLVDSDGSKLNTDNDYDTATFTRRFFVYDTLAGIDKTGGYKAGATPTVIRFAKNMTLVVSMQSSDHSKINRPYLEITYASKTVSSLSSNSTSFAVLQTEYYLNPKGFWTVVLILFIILNVFVLLIAMFSTYVWSKYNPSSHNPENWTMLVLLRFVLNLMRFWSGAMFFYLFVVTGYCFIFYKLQDTVYFIAPVERLRPTEFIPFIVVFALTVAFRFFTVLNMIREQANMDFFFIDWEKPKLTYKRELNRDVYLQSCWRTILIANEFNELQVQRAYSFEFFLVIFGFFMIGLKWENLAIMYPTMTTSVPDYVPANYVLKYFLTVFVLLVIGVVLYLLRRLVTLRFPTPVQNFVDLCSVANISLMVFDQKYHGYYVHGMSSSGQAELSIGELKRSLEAESKGTARGRGILANDTTNLQTYEIFIPYQFRKEYDEFFSKEKAIEMKKRSMKSEDPEVSKLVNNGFIDADYTKLEGKRLMIQNHLKEHIDKLRNESANLIKEKTPSMRFLGIPPVDFEKMQGSPLFYRDRTSGFQECMFFGNELSLLMMDILFYTMWDVITRNTFIAIFLCYFSHHLVRYLRSTFGEENLSKKTLIDDAFLI